MTGRALLRLSFPTVASRRTPIRANSMEAMLSEPETPWLLSFLGARVHSVLPSRRDSTN